MSEKNLVPQFILENLSNNQIIVLFDHQYLWKESTDSFSGMTIAIKGTQSLSSFAFRWVWSVVSLV